MPLPESAQNAPKGLTHTAIPPVLQVERTAQKISENDTEIYSLTVCRRHNALATDRSVKMPRISKHAAAGNGRSSSTTETRISYNPPLPWVWVHGLQAKLPGNRCSLSALLVKTLETARLRAVTIRYTSNFHEGGDIPSLST